jgi:nucleotidyltransferase substrate binding protein (TIGR01987 family)
LTRLEESAAAPLDNPLAIDATIQRFEFTIELHWKLLKRLLEHEGIETATPREALRQAYQAGWLHDEDAWLQVLGDRNESSHTYDEAKAREIYDHIRANLPELRRTYAFLAKRIEGTGHEPKS